MSWISSNPGSIIEKSRNIPKISRLYDSVEISGKNFQSHFPKPPKNSPVSIQKFHQMNRKIFYSTKTRNSSCSENNPFKNEELSKKISDFQEKNLDNYVKISRKCGKNSKGFSNFSTNNSSFNSNQSYNSPGSNSPKESNYKNNSKKRPSRAGVPARFLSVNEDKRAKSRNLPSFDQNDQDILNKILESDKLNFRLELVYRENRKHKLIQKFAKLEDAWEWSSYGSVSPERKVRFVE
jgi:hypothetical protein